MRGRMNKERETQRDIKSGEGKSDIELNSWIKNALKRFSAFFAVLCMPFVYD
jgi:hypothetical protein